MGQDFLAKAILYLVPMILSLSVHEYAHAWAAYRLGDDTAARQGRLTLSPAAHIDVFGTILLPLINIYIAGFSFIGWARPVPVVASRFSRSVNMRWGMMLTAAAGPLSNFALAFLSLALFRILVIAAPALLVTGTGEPAPFLGLLSAMVNVNVGLFVFNMLPIPPLDGSRLLPRSLDELQARLAPFSFFIILGIINIPALRYPLVEVPVRFVRRLLEVIFGVGLGY